MTLAFGALVRRTTLAILGTGIALFWTFLFILSLQDLWADLLAGPDYPGGWDHYAVSIGRQWVSTSLLFGGGLGGALLATARKEAVLGIGCGLLYLLLAILVITVLRTILPRFGPPENDPMMLHGIVAALVVSHVVALAACGVWWRHFTWALPWRWERAASP